MDANAAEIVVEPSFKKSKDRRRERIAAPPERVRSRRRRFPYQWIARGAGTAFRLSAVDLRSCGAGSEIRLRHAHDLGSDAIRLVLQRIIDCADFELRLNLVGRPLKRACSAGGKERDFAEIPRAPRRGLFRHLTSLLLLGTATRNRFRPALRRTTRSLGFCDGGASMALPMPHMIVARA
jgi:hypothetical protein